MIELVVVYCLLNQPDRCVERREVMEEPSSLMACTFTAQQAAQRWIAAHPAYHVARFRCERDRPREEPA